MTLGGGGRQLLNALQFGWRARERRNEAAVFIAPDGTSYMFNYALSTHNWAIAIIPVILLFARIWFLIRLGRRPGQLRKFGYWRRWASIFLVILLVIYFYWGAIPNPQFTLAKLKGLTPRQVIARLGPPTDKRHAAPPQHGQSFGADLRLQRSIPLERI